MNIRYRFKHRKDGRIERSIFSLEQIENGDLFASWQMCDWQILSRDIGTGLMDFGPQKEIFEKDKVIASGCCLEDEGEYVVKWWVDCACFRLVYEHDGKEYWKSNLEQDEIESLHLEIIGREEE